jgi:hypothetical protein
MSQPVSTQAPEIIRLEPTPVADEVVKERVSIRQNVFLGTAADMADIAAALRKVERK